MCRLAWLYTVGKDLPFSVPAGLRAKVLWVLFANIFKKNVFLYLQELTLNAAVLLEVTLWFFAGEVIGKRSIIGYPVKGERTSQTAIRII